MPSSYDSRVTVLGGEETRAESRESRDKGQRRLGPGSRTGRPNNDASGGDIRIAAQQSLK